MITMRAVLVIWTLLSRQVNTTLLPLHPPRYVLFDVEGGCLSPLFLSFLLLCNHLLYKWSELWKREWWWFQSSCHAMDLLSSPACEGLLLLLISFLRLSVHLWEMIFDVILNSTSHIWIVLTPLALSLSLSRAHTQKGGNGNKPMTPVTIKQLHTASKGHDEAFRLNGVELVQVSLLCVATLLLNCVGRLHLLGVARELMPVKHTPHSQLKTERAKSQCGFGQKVMIRVTWISTSTNGGLRSSFSPLWFSLSLCSVCLSIFLSL